MTLPIYKAARSAAQIPKLPYLANYINCVIDNNTPELNQKFDSNNFIHL